MNTTSEEMEVRYAANKSILIEGKETCRIPIEIERCSLDREDTDCLALSPALLASKCKAHLMQQVKLEYVISTAIKEVTGQASIDAIPWTQAMLETILMSPVEWQVRANGNELPIERPELNCAVGETVEFCIRLSNHSDQPIMYLSLWIEMYLEQSNGIKNYDVDSKILLEAGKDKVYVEEVGLLELLSVILTDTDVPLRRQIKAGAVMVHEVSYIFLTSGTYRMEVQSSGYDGNLVSHELLTTGAQNLKAQQQAQSLSAARSADSAADPHSLTVFSDQPGCKTSPSLWKLVPAVAINVF